jgi:hypothetical protein
MEAVNLLSSNKYTEKQIVNFLFRLKIYKHSGLFIHFRFDQFEFGFDEINYSINKE